MAQRMVLAAIAGLCGCIAVAARAQPTAPFEGIDLTIGPQIDTASERECRRRQEAAALRGEIVVCGARRNDAEAAGWDREAFENRYAERSAFAKDPRTPKFILTCKDQGNPPGCVAMGSAPPPAYIVDFSALPDAPAGSDADRMARGLAPLGNDGATPEPASNAAAPVGDRQDVPPPALAQKTAVSPSGSAEPAAPQ